MSARFFTCNASNVIESVLGTIAWIEFVLRPVKNSETTEVDAPLVVTVCKVSVSLNDVTYPAAAWSPHPYAASHCVLL